MFKRLIFVSTQSFWKEKKYIFVVAVDKDKKKTSNYITINSKQIITLHIAKKQT